MLHSMTGFATLKGEQGAYGWTWDMRGVNAKGLDLRLRVPDWIEGLETALRAQLAKSVIRGNVSLSLRVQRDDANAAASLNTDQLNAVLIAMAEVEAQVLANATTFLENGQLDSATALAERAAVVGLDDKSVQTLKAAIADQQNRSDSVNSLLVEAKDLMAQGFLTEPENNNAVALLLNVLQLQPSNSEAKGLLESAAAQLAAVAQEAYDVGLTDEANNYMDLALTIAPEAAEWREMRDE